MTLNYHLFMVQLSYVAPTTIADYRLQNSCPSPAFLTWTLSRHFSKVPATLSPNSSRPRSQAQSGINYISKVNKKGLHYFNKVDQKLCIHIFKYNLVITQTIQEVGGYNIQSTGKEKFPDVWICAGEAIKR